MAGDLDDGLGFISFLHPQKHSGNPSTIQVQSKYAISSSFCSLMASRTSNQLLISTPPGDVIETGEVDGGIHRR